MPRELRAHKSKPNYASLAAIGDEEDAEIPKPLLDEDEDSGSDFAPDKLSADAPGDLQNVAEDPPEVEEALKRGKRRSAAAGSGPIARLSSRTGNGQSHTKPPPKIQSAQTSTSKTPAPRIAKMYALPNPSVHHRHRAIPVFLRKERVERLDAPSKLFNPPDIVLTNSMTSEPSLTDRISKAWGYNVGSGPVWNIMEDRSWFKEALEAEENPEYESYRRPRVHQGVTMKPGWEILNDQ